MTTRILTREVLARPDAARPLPWIWPFARAPYYAARGTWARIRARMPVMPGRQSREPIFILGCGRSGTTLLGELFGLHPSLHYINEPFDLWAAIDPATDYAKYYSTGESHCLLDGTSVTPVTRHRFRRLLGAPRALTMVEKTPINTLRIGYLDALAPDARFVHIVRDGVDVARSIERFAAVTRRMVFRPALNDWWGVGHAKWVALALDGRAAGYYPEEVDQLTTNAQRGAYEWLVSVREVDAWRTSLGSRYVELRYPDLTDDPKGSLRFIMDSLAMPCPERWLQSAAARVRPARSHDGTDLILPDRIRTDFNALQARFGFEGRAIADATGDSRSDSWSRQAASA
jgi:Sulfotransferase family